ncbi:hypothetical protein SMICM17S_02610 [Streptomyces microflavus]
MALDEARASGTHGGGCTCGDCPHGAREGHRRAVAAFLAKRDELAAGNGLPAGVAQSASASRQWVSDELTESARTVAERGRAAGDVWLHHVWRGTLFAVWGAVIALLVGASLTAIGPGWTTARTAGLLAALVTAVLLTVAARFHRARGGLLAPLIGEDNRLSTSRTVAAAWVLLAVFAVLVLALQLAGASDHEDRDALIQGLDLVRSAGVLTVLALVCAVAVVVRRVVTVRVLGRRLQKLRADRPRAADLLTDDSGRGSFRADLLRQHRRARQQHRRDHRHQHRAETGPPSSEETSRPSPNTASAATSPICNAVPSGCCSQLSPVPRPPATSAVRKTSPPIERGPGAAAAGAGGRNGASGLGRPARAFAWAASTSVSGGPHR